MSTAESLCWWLDVYARHQSAEGDNGTKHGNNGGNNDSELHRRLGLDGSWKYLSSAATTPILLSVNSSSHLTITQGNSILESHPIVGTAVNNMAVYFYGESMLFVSQLTEDSVRRFRIKFSSSNGRRGEESCLQCATVLTRFFTVQQLSNDNQSTYIAKSFTPNTTTTTNAPLPSMEAKQVTVDKMAEMLLKQDPKELSTAYEASKMKGEKINKILHLCLSDPTFPMFVKQVEEQIKQFKN